jgi:galactonate dehydratase
MKIRSTSWYRDLVTDLPKVSHGLVEPLTNPGLGTQLLPDLIARPDVHRRSSRR